MKFNPYNGPFRSKVINSIKAKPCPCCKADMKAISIKNDYVDDWRYECQNCNHMEY